MILDQVMVDKPNKRELEWRCYVGDTASGAVLFRDAPGFGDVVRPDLVVRQPCAGNWMSHGVSDYLKTGEAAWLLKCLDKEWLERQFKESIAVDAHGSSEATYERERVGRIMATRWPVRGEFIEVPLDLTPLEPAPGLRRTVEAWYAAVAQGRAVTEEDNMAAMGLGNREISLLGGYDRVIAQAPPEKLARIRPLRKGPAVDCATTVDQNIQAGLAVHCLHAPDFGLYLQPIRERSICVVAGAHGSGLSRLARRFRQHTVTRFDRLAKAWVGLEAYERPWDHPGDCERHHRNMAGVVAAHLASGARPDLRCLLTHEAPDVIVEELQRRGIRAWWVLYTPDEVERAKRVAERNVQVGVRMYMLQVLRELYRRPLSSERVYTEEDMVSTIRGMTPCRVGVG